MPQPQQLGEAGLVGWRKAIADRVGGPVSRRTPLSEDQVRALVGAAFFALAAYYVIGTTARLVKVARG